ncbi:unnamed protein product [Blepharisma stoltei]|uniref:EGF-like domain-containing protein n=1 Tax=Blepharisma stoltei TaxID=1481888 RepID=A0AAU9IRV2_9CILI|nr:unnamed protein product [Blepharisma stoltei]
MKKTEIAVFFLLFVCFSSASPIFSLQKSHDFPQFLPKKLAETAEFQGKYKPIRIYSEVNSGSQDNDALLEDFESSASRASEILSHFLLVHPSRQPIKLGENNHCNSTHIRNPSKYKGIDADLAVFFTMNNNLGQNSSSFRICKVSDDNRMISIDIEIDAKFYKGHDKLSKINLLSVAIIQGIFQNSFEEKVKILEELEKELEKQREILGACPASCSTCDNTGTVCTACNTGYYLSGSVCSACQAPCASCQTTATTCLSCDDTGAMTLSNNACTCNDPNALFNTQSLLCQCKTGYYQGTNSCQACQNPCSACSGSATTCTACVAGYYLHVSLCLTCQAPCLTCSTSSTACTSCDDSSNMNLNTNTNTCTCKDPNASFNTVTTKCACNSGYWGTPGSCTACQSPCSSCTTSGTTCSSCVAGYWLNGINCFPCVGPCATCSTSASACVTCDDSAHMTQNGDVCTCTDQNAYFNTQTLLCQCNAGYFGSPNACTACSPQCSTCTNTAGNCQVCSDPTHMTAAPACSCPTNGVLSGTSCVCNSGYYFSSNTVCAACTTPCAQCSGSATTCTGCVDGYYLHGNVCLTCQPPCFECSGTSTFCTTCDDSNNMINNAGTCTCKDPNASFSTQSATCACNTGYWNSAGTCTACTAPCTACSTSGTTCTACPNGYYLNGSTCSLCQAPCATCSNSATFCLTCDDSQHTSLNGGVCSCIDQNASFNTQSLVCQCNPGYFGAPNSCTACASNCATCTGTSTACSTCEDTTHMTAAPACACPLNSAQVDSACICNNGYYFSTNTVCSSCAPQCSTCSALTQCTQCSDLIHMGPAPTCSCPANGALQGSTCVCNAGYFFSTNTVCSSCSSNCVTCTSSAGNCLTCSDATHMSAAPACTCPANSVLTNGACVCPNGFFYSTATSCVACAGQCATCSTTNTNCQTCSDPTHMTAAPACSCPTNGVLSGTSCVCNSGYYFSSNTVCAACTTPCAQCSGSATTCTGCVDGYYLHGNVCLTCQPPCFECSGTSTFCTTCDDSNNMINNAGTCTCKDPNASFSTQSATCVCNTGYWNSAGTCTACTAPCTACSTSGTTCTACPNGYYLNGSTCSLCQAPCATCSNSATNCLTCDDPTDTTLNGGVCSCTDQHASFNAQNTACQCSPGYFGAANSCTACTINCATCSNSAANCQLCQDTIHMTSPPACACPSNSAQIGSSCVCNNGFFYSSSTVCSACAPQCSTCSALTQCTQCSDTVHMSPIPACSCPANGALQGSTCICNTGYFFSSSTVCSSCNSNCATCSTTAGNCLTCSDATHMSAAPVCTCPSNSVLTNGACVCPNGFFYSTATSCVACAGQCATCSTTNTNCQTCSDPTHMTAAPACSCPTNGVLSGTSCVCNSGYYFSSNTVCAACTTPCAQCSGSATTCTGCIDGYYLHGNVCLTCQPPCFECSGTSTFCTTCDDSNNMINNAGTCTCKDPNASFNTQSATCVCNTGFWNSVGTCTACIAPCTACSTSGTTCTACPNGYYLNGSTCSLCQAPCVNCVTSATNCLTCEDPTHMSAAPTCSCPSYSTLVGNACTCNSGYFYSSTTQCSQCDPHCSTCSTSATTCVACSDSTHMTPAPACVCPANSSLFVSSCVCNQGYYYSSSTVCSACSTNCLTCSTQPTICDTCVDSVHMTSPPGCYCPANSILSGNSCVCNNGFYFSSNSLCSVCSSNCATCNTGNACLTCVDTTHMTAAPNCQCPANSSLQGNACVCNAGYYFSDNLTCSPCQGNCKTCSTSATTCTSCTDSVHMGDAPICNCPGASTVVQGACVCNAGYYFSSNTVCSECQDQCATCSGSADNCLACVDTTHMTGAPACACPANSAIVQNACVCNTGYFYSSVTQCSACASQCATCSNTNTNCNTCIDTTHMTAAPTCACPSNSILIGGTCTCSQGYFYSTATTCTQCQPQCLTCSNSATNCDSCTDTVHMTAAPACACPTNSAISNGKCICNTGYYFSSNGVCSPCASQCATCSISNTSCSTCVDHVHMSNPPTCSCPSNSVLTAGNCVCNAGYFFSTATVCTQCATQCSACSGSSTTCSACVDTVHAAAAPSCACPANSSLVGNSCVCNTGYYYSSATTCSPCQVNCATCDTNPNTCDTCIDPTHMNGAPSCSCPQYSTLTTGSCICNTGYFYSSTTPTVCSACASNCQSCSISSTNCNVCIDTVHMPKAPQCLCPTLSTLVGNNCVCNTGYYWSTNALCSACSINCVSCTNSATNCVSCVDTVHMSAAPACACPANSALVGNTCQCNPGYYYSSNSVCSPCSIECATCATNPAVCDTCIDPTHMSQAPACQCPAESTLVAGSCTCAAGYYFSSATDCSACSSQCSTCSQSSTNCNTCVDTVHMSPTPACNCPTSSTLVGTTCVCNNGYFYSSSTVCSPCSPNCSTCVNTQGNCQACSDPTHMTAAPNCACPPNSSLVNGNCVCNNGYYYSSNTVCSPCNSLCQTCNTSPTACTACTDSTHSNGPPTCACPANSVFTNNACVCNTGYFYSTNTECSQCANNCQSCVNSALNCQACVDSVHMSAAPQCICPAQSTLVNNLCVCNTGFYYSSNTQCSPCSSQCSTCQTSTTNCLTCIDNVHMSAAPQCNCPANSLLTAGNCVCNSGYYFSSNTICSACSSQCSTCVTSQSNCLTCVDTTHMSAAPSCSCPTNSALTGGSCVCNTGYYYSSNTVCSACNTQCSTCVTSAANCLTCVDNVHMTAAPQCACPQYSTLTQASCVCNQGYYYSSNSVCSACSAPCSQCVNQSTFCTACFDSTHMTLSNGQCTCTDPNATFSTNSNTCVCNNGFYNNGAGKCLLCSVGCAICSAANKCSQCYDANNMVNLQTGTCSCIDNKAQFNPTANVCQCQPGYYKTSSGCQSCSLGCQTCTSPTNCQTCFDQIHTTIWSDGSCHCDDSDANFDASQQKCVCDDGFWNSGGACISCPLVCKTCSSQFACTTCFDPSHTVISAGVCVCSDPNAQFNTANEICGCKSGYYLNGNSCSSCGNGCSSCGDSTSCTSCYDTQNAAVVNGICKCNDKNASIYPGSTMCSCNPGYYNSQTNVCTACDAGCSSCTDTNSCKICFDQENSALNNGVCTCIDPDKIFSTEEEMCVCKNGYYLEAQSNTCKACDATCAICSAANVCITCQDSGAMTNNNDGTCSCTSKNDKFSLETDQCESKSGSVSLSFSWLALIGLIMMNWD